LNYLINDVFEVTKLLDICWRGV